MAPAVEDPSGELKARFDSWTIPAGLRDKATWKAALDRHPDTAQARISLETSLFLLGDGGQAGEATCLLGVEPLEHPGGGAEYEIPVRSKGAGT